MSLVTGDLLSSLLSADLTTRRKGEDEYNSIPIPARCESILSLLLQPKPCPQSKMLSLVLLRREISKMLSASNDLSSVKNLIESMLGPLSRVFSSCGVDGDRPCQRMAGHCIAECCLNLSILDDGGDGMRTVMAGIAEGCVVADVASLRLLANVADRAPISFWRCLEGTGSVLASAVEYSGGLAPDGDRVDALLTAFVKIGIACLAVESFGSNPVVGGVSEMEASYSIMSQSPSHRACYSVNPSSPSYSMSTLLLPPLLHLLQSSGSSFSNGLESLVECSEKCPSLLIPSLPTLMNFLLPVSSSHNLDAETRLTALEVLSILIDGSDNDSPSPNPTMAGLSPAVPAILQTLTELSMTSLDLDVDSWIQSPPELYQDEDFWEGDDISLYAESLLASFLAVPESIPIMSQIATKMLQTDDWRAHRTAIQIYQMTVCSSAAQLQLTFPVALEGCAHPHPRVRHSSLGLLGTLCLSDTSEDPQIKIHSQNICHAVRMNLSPDNCDRVMSMATLALVSFCRGGDGDSDAGCCVPPELLLPHLGGILESLSAGPLSRSPRDGTVALMRGIGAVACLADASEEAFREFYPVILPGLLNCIHSAGEALAPLRGAAVEACGIVFCAVGMEVSQNDAIGVLNLCRQCLEEGEGRIPVEELLATCARIGGALGEEFAEFLPFLLPLLLERAGREAKVYVCDQDGEEGNEDSVEVNLPGKGVTKLVMNTHGMQEKSQACRAIYELGSSLGETLAPFVEGCVSVLLPLVSFQFSSEVRSTSSQALTALYSCAPNPSSFLAPLLQALVEQLTKEDTQDIETMFAIADSISDVLYHAYSTKNTILSTPQLEITTQCLLQLVHQCLTRRSSLLQNNITASDCEADLLSPLVDSIGYLLKSHPQLFIPIFDTKVHPVLQPLLTSPDPNARLSSICLYIDHIEFCHAFYAPLILPVLITNLDHSPSDLQRACVYGIAQIVRTSPDTLSPHAERVISALCDRCADEDDECLVENAVSALGSMCVFPNAPYRRLCGDGPRRGQCLDLFLGNLPLALDASEAKIAHSGFCDLVECDWDEIVGADAGRVLKIISEILMGYQEVEDILTEECVLRIGGILGKMRECVDAEVMEGGFRELTEDGRAAIQEMLGA